MEIVKVAGLDEFFEQGCGSYSLTLQNPEYGFFEATIYFNDEMADGEVFSFGASTASKAIEGVVAKAVRAGHPYRMA